MDRCPSNFCSDRKVILIRITCYKYTTYLSSIVTIVVNKADVCYYNNIRVQDALYMHY